MFRYEVPIDDQPHKFVLHGGWPVAAEAVLSSRNVLKGPYVEFWAEHDDDEETIHSTFQVYETGHPIPNNGYHILTAPRNGGLVFHLIELTDESE